MAVIEEFADELLEKNPNSYKNKKGNTWLHMAAEYGMKKSTNAVIQKFENKLLTAKNNYDENFLHSCLRSMKVPKDRILSFMDELDEEVIKKVAKEPKIEKESLLHIAAFNDYYQLVPKLKMVDVNKRDVYGDRPAHVAAKFKKFATLKRIVETFKRKDDTIDGMEAIDLKATDNDGETVLHVAMRQGDAEVVAHLIKSGCDLDAPSNNGNTPLHCLVEQAALAADDPDRLEPYLKIWQTVVEESLYWWCRKHGGHKPARTSKLYKPYKRDALFYLRSELRNDRGLTVLQYATQEGVTALVREMIWVEDIFVFSREELEDEIVESENITVIVTNLMPHVRSDKVKYRQCGQKKGDAKLVTYKGLLDKHKKDRREREEQDEVEIQKDLKNHQSIRLAKSGQSFKGRPRSHKPKKKNPPSDLLKFDEIWDSYVDPNDKTLLQPFLRIDPPNKASEVMDVEPLKKLIRDYWFVRQWFTVVLMAAHLVHMVFYTNYCADITFAAYKPNVTGKASVKPNFGYLIWPSFMVLSKVLFIFFVLFRLLRMCCNCCAGFQLVNIKHLIKRNYKMEPYIDVKDVFKWPSLLLSVTSALLHHILPWSFFALTLASLLHTSEDGSTTFHLTIIFSVFIGWIMTFYWARSFEPVYRFTTALHHIILKDLISFFLFFLFVLLAFSSAFYMIFQTVPDLDQNLSWEDFSFVLYDFFLKGCGQASRISAEDVSDKITQSGESPVLFDFLFSVYMIITRMLFFSMLTTTFLATYREFAGTGQNGWRQNSLKVSRSVPVDWLSGKVLHPVFKKMGITSRTIWQSPDTNHYYITMSRKHLNEYRLLTSSLQPYDWDSVSDESLKPIHPLKPGQGHSSTQPGHQKPISHHSGPGGYHPISPQHVPGQQNPILPRPLPGPRPQSPSKHYSVESLDNIKLTYR